MTSQRPPTLYCLLGPPAVGKSTLFRRIQVGNEDVAHLGLHPLVSYTTRPPRADDVDGVDYHFVSRSRFEEELLVAPSQGLVTTVGEHQYGIRADTVRNHLTDGKHGLIVLNNEGYERFKFELPDIRIFSIFLLPASFRRVMDTLIARANGGDATARIEYARQEMEGAAYADIMPVATTQASTFAVVADIIEKHQQWKSPTT